MRTLTPGRDRADDLMYMYSVVSSASFIAIRAALSFSFLLRSPGPSAWASILVDHPAQLPLTISVST